MVSTFWGSIDLVQGLSFGDLLQCFLLTIIIVLQVFRILQSAFK